MRKKPAGKERMMTVKLADVLRVKGQYYPLMFALAKGVVRK